MNPTERNRSFLPAALTAVLGVFGGATVMYYFDPRLGHRRRVMLRDRTNHLARAGYQLVQGTLVDVAQRTRGLGFEVAKAFRNEPVSEDVLVARVRSTLGHYLPTMRGIEVSAKGDSVILRGPCDPLDVPEVIRMIEALPGVGTVQNFFSSIKPDSARRAG